MELYKKMANANDYEMFSEEEVIDRISLDDLEEKLYSDLDNEITELEILKEQKEKIGNPDALGKVIKNVIWEQFQNQLGVQLGEEFIEKNRGLTLDLRNEAHIQTTENFANGNIAIHNTEIDYQKRFDDWQSNFQKDENGNIITHETRSGKQESTLVKGARKPFDDNRPSGSKIEETDMDHDISAGEIIRDAEANAHLTKEEQIGFANSEANLNEIPSSWNRSKGDKSMEDWLNNPNKNGQKPEEIFNDLTKEEQQKLLEKDRKAREEYTKVKNKGKERSIKTGRQSQKEEFFRISNTMAKAVVLQLLKDFLKEIASKLIKWFKSNNKKLDTLLDSLKDAIKSFIKGLKQKLLNIGNTVVTTIATAIAGPIVNSIKRVWIFLKQGWSSFKEAVTYLRSAEAKSQPFDIVMLQVGKIIMGAITAGGALLLSNVIENGLMVFPVFNIQIPLLGSLANVLGIFLGAVVAGIVGAIVINLIEKTIAKKQSLKVQIDIARQTEVVLKSEEKKVWEHLGIVYDAVGQITNETADSLRSSVQKERNSFKNLQDDLARFQSLIK